MGPAGAGGRDQAGLRSATGEADRSLIGSSTNCKPLWATAETGAPAPPRAGETSPTPEDRNASRHDPRPQVGVGRGRACGPGEGHRRGAGHHEGRGRLGQCASASRRARAAHERAAHGRGRDERVAHRGRGRGPAHGVPHGARARARGRRRLVLARARQDARHRGRVRVGQVGADALAARPAAAPQRGRRGPRRARRARPGHALDPRAAQGLGPRGRHHLPGPDDLAQPGGQDRQADHGVAALPHGHVARPGQPARRGAARLGRHPRAAAPAQLLSARALGRHAPARHDRHRAGLRAKAAGGGRADDGPRRDRAGDRSSTCCRNSSASATWR